MIRKKRIMSGIAFVLTAAMLLGGCGAADVSESDTGMSDEAEESALDSETIYDEVGDAEAAETGEGDSLAEELRKKYSGNNKEEYDGNVIKVKRDESLQIEVGYNPWDSDISPSESFVFYQDADLNFPVEVGGYDYNPESGILTIEPPYYGIAEIHSSEIDISHLEGSYLSENPENGWGTLPQYYMKTCVDTETGEALSNPVITVIKVDAEIEQAPQLVFDQTDEGYARFTWKEVPGADGYLLFRINKDETGLYDYSYAFADVEGTEWDSKEEAFLNDEDASEVLSLNYRFEYYYSSDDFSEWVDESGNELLKEYMVEGDYDEFYSEYYGVIAYNENGCSPISNLFSAKDLSHMLPEKAATHSNDASRHGISGTLGLPATMGVTMCDGSTEQKVIDYDYGSIEKNEESHFFHIKGTLLQTPFTWDFGAYDVDWDSFEADLETVKERQEKLINKGGNVAPSLTVEEGTEPESEEPEKPAEEPEKPEQEEPADEPEKPETKITANSAMSEYIALNMLETKKEINLSAFPEAADTQYIIDAFFEAQYQNPLILGVRGGNIDPAKRILYVDYDFDREETSRKQEEIQARVTEIVGEMINDGMSDAEKEMAINTWLCENAVYDDSALENAEEHSFSMVDEEFYDSFTAYGILMNGVGVCASYSAAFKLLADEAGLDSIVVTGYLSGSLPHAWNKVKIEDNWYIVDATNNDNEMLPNALLNLSDKAAYETLVEDARFVLDSSTYQYAAGTDELEFYHTENRYYDKNQVAGELAALLSSDGRAVLRTDYDIDDEEFYSIAQEAADKSQKNITGFYWMGVIRLEE